MFLNVSDHLQFTTDVDKILFEARNKFADEGETAAWTAGLEIAVLIDYYSQTEDDAYEMLEEVEIGMDNLPDELKCTIYNKILEAIQATAANGRWAT